GKILGKHAPIRNACGIDPFGINRVLPFKGGEQGAGKVYIANPGLVGWRLPASIGPMILIRVRVSDNKVLLIGQLIKTSEIVNSGSCPIGGGSSSSSMEEEKQWHCRS